MNKEQILKKALTKALKGGARLENIWFFSIPPNMEVTKVVIPEGALGDLLIEDNYYKVIFSHDFAKAFWGEKIDIKQVGKKRVLNPVSWKQHLMTMVLEPEPLKYIAQFLEEEK